MKNNFIYCLLLLSFVACQEENLPVESLYGNWKVTQVYENHKPKDLGAGVVQFHFNENGRYTFGSGSNNIEAGTFFIKGKQLHTTDTINPQAIKKAVSITLLTADSLFLDMNKGGVPQLWECARQ